MIEDLVPATVTAVATRADLTTELFAEEVRSLGSAVDARRRELETGRACAHRALAAHDAGDCWERVLFSAEEAVFKAWSPLTGQALAFEAADVRIDVDGGTFTATLHDDELRGRWGAGGGIVATAVVVAR